MPLALENAAKHYNGLFQPILFMGPYVDGQWQGFPHHLSQKNLERSGGCRVLLFRNHGKFGAEFLGSKPLSSIQHHPKRRERLTALPKLTKSFFKAP